MTFERGRLNDQTRYDSLEAVGIAGSPDVTVESRLQRNSFYRKYGKRMFDVTLVLLAAPVWVPLVLLLAAIVMLDRGNPFYSQDRVGLGGRTFRMWKIRSMVTGADKLLGHYLTTNPAIRAEWDEKQKLAQDPRITRIGKILRMTSLDELPQLWNILLGDMTLVGPRPMMVDQKSLYPGTAYYALRPGATGPWQISARNKSSFRERARYDERYLDQCSVAVDLETILKTVPVILAARGV